MAVTLADPEECEERSLLADAELVRVRVELCSVGISEETLELDVR